MTIPFPEVFQGVERQAKLIEIKTHVVALLGGGNERAQYEDYWLGVFGFSTVRSTHDPLYHGQWPHT